MSYSIFVNGKEFIKKARKYAKKNGLGILVTTQGKGGHQTLKIGNKRTVVQTGELPTGTFHAMLKQLGIEKSEF